MTRIKYFYTTLFFLLSIFYFWYAFKVYIPNKTTTNTNYFVFNESSRHVLKVAILNEKGFRYYLNAIMKKDEDILYDSIDLTSAAQGFLTSFSFDKVKEVSLLKKLIEKNTFLMEKYKFDISLKNLEIIRKNTEKISKISIIIETKKYNSLVEGLIKKETKTYSIITSIIYLSICIIILVSLLLYSFLRNKKLQKDNLKQQKILLTQSKNIALGEMLSNIAHQWRQPLSVITTSVSGLKLFIDLGKRPDNSLILKCSQEIMDQAKYLSKTINEFDSFNNLLTNNSLKEKNVKITDVFYKLEALIINSFNEHSIKIIKNIQDDITVVLDENILISSIINIYHNSEDAFISNNIKTKERYFFIKIEKIKNNISIQLNDTAGGIKRDVIEKIFEPYFTTKHKSRGKGIGLHRTNQIITKYLNGSIDVKNLKFRYKKKEYKGALFTVLIPIKQIMEI